MTEDRELARAMLEGDERAFTRFFDTYFPRVYRFALPRVNGSGITNRSHDDATIRLRAP